VVPSRRRLDVTVDLRNDGWSDARDVGVRIAASHACLDAGSILVDDVPAARTSRRHARRDGATALGSLRRDGDATIVDVALIPARGNLRIAFVAAPFAASSEGAFTVSVGGRTVEAPYAVPQVREVRMRPIEMPQRVSPGESAAYVVRVANAGDADENVMVAVAASAAAGRSGPAECAIRPGSFVDVSLEVDVPEDVGDGDAFRPVITAFDSTGERARVCATSVARHRTSLDAGAEPKLDDDDERPIRALVHTALRAPSTALAGAPIGISLDLDVEDAADAIAIRTDPPQGTRYVPGSARLDDRALLDRTGSPDASSPLEGEGLTLRAVPAGTRVTLEWSLLTDPATDGATVDVTAVVEVDGDSHVVAPAGVELRARDPFVARPAGMRYHVEACSLGPARAHVDETAASPAPLELDRERPYEVDPAEVAAAPATLTMRLTRARIDEVGRLLHGARGRGLVAHLFALRLFFPDGIEPPDAVAAAQLDALNAALRDVYDRLFVQLRIPGFAACADDLEDPALRAALVVFSDRLGGAGFADVPFGAPAALRALVGLRPARCDDDPALAAAISRYAQLVDGVLAEYEGLSLELFDDALARRDDSALDEARDTVLAALRAHLVTAQIAC
ncbi:MAG: hypothetical protein JWO66_870, partial [Candidatus Eremiobacteraeota bacterium]|nr:hypothetical protein [Candidatus Eremiobacteraeota bacterium]